MARIPTDDLASVDNGNAGSFPNKNGITTSPSRPSKPAAHLPTIQVLNVDGGAALTSHGRPSPLPRSFSRWRSLEQAGQFVPEEPYRGSAAEKRADA